MIYCNLAFLYAEQGWSADRCASSYPCNDSDCKYDRELGHVKPWTVKGGCKEQDFCWIETSTMFSF